MFYMIFFSFDDFAHLKVTHRLTFDFALRFAERFDFWLIARGYKDGSIFVPVEVVARSSSCREHYPCSCFDNIGIPFEVVR